MSKRWLSGLAVLWLASAGPAGAEDPLSLISVSAILPQAPSGVGERPSELPNIDPQLDIKPLIRPPAPEPKRMPLRDRLKGAEYDPSYLFLPERNPGLRQPPCPCLPLGSWWVNTAYFLGKTQNDSIPALATAGGSGLLGANGVTVLQGNQHLEQPFRSGLRLEGGAWIDRCHTWGLDGSFFFMQSTEAKYATASNGDPLLARPFTGPNNTPLADVLAAPGASVGSIQVASPLTFLAADVNTRNTLFCEDNRRLDLLAGYRIARMTEEVSIQSHSTSTNGNARNVQDVFRTVNLFNGGQLGLAGELRFDRLYLSGATKIAFGENWNHLAISGETQTTSAASTVTNPNGLLATRALIGTRDGRNFAVMPEANFTAGYQVNDNWRAYVGYTFVYISSVARPGQAIDLNTAPATVPNRNDANADFWMHGINLGIEARY